MLTQLSNSHGLIVRLSVRTAIGALGSMAALFSVSTHVSAQTTAEADTQSDGLQEVVVTAERRSQDVQKVAASVEVLNSGDLTAQGRNTTQQILETITNLTVGQALGQSNTTDNPDGNITIRGVQTEQGNGGFTSAPPTTAVYVDDVYQGIGSDLDIDRIEVLRGPQGTLYGRSATGGVVAFHTNDPTLGKFTGDASGEYGSYDLTQISAAVNVPLGDQLALRIAAKNYEQGNGYYDNQGTASRYQEARAKLLYQPTGDLRILLGWAFREGHANGGGNSIQMPTPSTYNYFYSPTAVYTVENRFHQFWANVNYDMGFANLTYIGAYHDYGSDFTTPPTLSPSGLQTHAVQNPQDYFHTEELRLTSNSSDSFQWMIGANYYDNPLQAANVTTQITAETTTGATDPTPGAVSGVPIFATKEGGRTRDYGVFTEETFAFTSDFKVTAGARFDRTTVFRSESFLFNGNIDVYGNSLNPPNELAYAQTNNLGYRNFTYKLRGQYDLTSDNLLYAMVSSGFLPGDQQIQPLIIFGASGFGGVNFVSLPFDQERLTAYEVGSKNRFFNNSLQINADAYYYDYSGYHELANISSVGPPNFVVLSVPVRIIGGELDGVWRITNADQLTVGLGLTDAQITSFPSEVAGTGHDARYYIQSSRVPGVPLASASAFYSHSFALPSGSSLVPRAGVLYTSGRYLSTYTQPEALMGEAPYNYQDGVALINGDVTWTSKSGNYSATAYGRNLSDVRYKSGSGLSTTGLYNITATLGAPRTFGVVLSAHF